MEDLHVIFALGLILSTLWQSLGWGVGGFHVWLQQENLQSRVETSEWMCRWLTQKPKARRREMFTWHNDPAFFMQKKKRRDVSMSDREGRCRNSPGHLGEGKGFCPWTPAYLSQESFNPLRSERSVNISMFASSHIISQIPGQFNAHIYLKTTFEESPSQKLKVALTLSEHAKRSALLVCKMTPAGARVSV